MNTEAKLSFAPHAKQITHRKKRSFFQIMIQKLLDVHKTLSKFCDQAKCRAYKKIRCKHQQEHLV